MQTEYTLTPDPTEDGFKDRWASGSRGKFTGQKAARSQKRKRRDMRRRYPHGW